MIRERAREKREKKQAVWEERKLAREEKMQEQKEGQETGKEQEKQHPLKRVVEEDSSSEEEGWCEGVMAFRGTGSVGVEEEVLEEEEGEKVITDDEDEKLSLNTAVVVEEEAKKVVVEDPEVVEEAGTKIEAFHEEHPNEDMQGKTTEELPYGEKISVEGGESSDEAPEELKIVKSYDNEIIEDVPKAADSEEKTSKTRKRKRKAGPKESAKDEAKEEEASKEEAFAAYTEPKAKVSRPGVFEQRIRPPTLLERLLLQEIKKERNTILQCVRYVCKNKFFDDTGDEQKST